MSSFDKTKRTNFFLLLKRGQCPFATKIQNAQHFGAQVVIIEDYNPTEKADQNVYPPTEGLLSAHIPLFEIDFASGKKIREAVNKNDTVFLRATLEIAQQNNKVEVDLWYASSLDLGM